MAIPQRDKASPWPFVAMVGMAGCFFLYAASGLLAPWYGVALLLAIWVALFVVATRWWTPHPRRTLLQLVDPVDLDPGFLTKLRNFRMPGTVAKLDFALSALPAFRGVGKSSDLRGRVLATVEAGATPGAAARRFAVGRSTACRWAAEARTEGRRAAKRVGGGPKPRITGEVRVAYEVTMRMLP